MAFGSGAAPKPLERVMIFIDGGYLRKLFIDKFGDDNINFSNLRNQLLKWYHTVPTNPFRANLIRIYYYDGLADPKAHEQQREYFETLESRNIFLTVVLGEAVKESNGKFRQKGVDILLAIDALSMAYLDNYDSGLFVLGDRDFIPLIEAVKATGKKTFGFWYNEKVSKELSRVFDSRFPFNKENMERWRLTGKPKNK